MRVFGAMVGILVALGAHAVGAQVPVYQDDVLGTTQPAYAAPGSDDLSIALGGVDDVDIDGMSGGWVYPPVGPSSVTGEWSIEYPPNSFEPNECINVAVTFGDTRVDYPSFCGGSSTTLSGSFEVSGEGVLVLAAQLTRKTYPNELATIRFANVVIVPDTVPDPDPVPDPEPVECAPHVELAEHPACWSTFTSPTIAWAPSSGPLVEYRVLINGVEFGRVADHCMEIECSGTGSSEITVIAVGVDGTEVVSEVSAPMFCSCPAPDLDCSGEVDLSDWNKFGSLWWDECRTTSGP